MVVRQWEVTLPADKSAQYLNGVVEAALSDQQHLQVQGDSIVAVHSKSFSQFVCGCIQVPCFHELPRLVL